ncbi:hypothetical protein HPB50_017210 [Hyalomma asiaticum]|uniref:Uncharacterized protein n=1 Tax=Hyalomma asiaticum TaxID=266040 RepID=A0ACB7SAH9_HYAAI|nr:hypothetical protein HPB50_017210 [Hyalomma asiaticum]
MKRFLIGAAGTLKTSKCHGRLPIAAKRVTLIRPTCPLPAAAQSRSAAATTRRRKGHGVTTPRIAPMRCPSSQKRCRCHVERPFRQRASIVIDRPLSR